MEQIEIPYQRIAPETLRKLVEDYITREGTDYGEQEVELEQKINQVMALLRSGEVLITWDLETETGNLQPKKDLR